MEVGYRTSNGNSCASYQEAERKNCSTKTTCYELVNKNSLSSKYDFCVFKKTYCNGKNHDCTNAWGKKSTRYKVIAFMYFDMPIIGGLVKIPVSGETVSFTEIKS